jgi:hypothetical protein
MTSKRGGVCFEGQTRAAPTALGGCKSAGSSRDPSTAHAARSGRDDRSAESDKDVKCGGVGLGFGEFVEGAAEKTEQVIEQEE